MSLFVSSLRVTPSNGVMSKLASVCYLKIVEKIHTSQLNSIKIRWNPFGFNTKCNPFKNRTFLLDLLSMRHQWKRFYGNYAGCRRISCYICIVNCSLGFKRCCALIFGYAQKVKREKKKAIIKTILFYRQMQKLEQ